MEKRVGFRIELDLHGMRVWEAQQELDRALDRAGKEIKEVIVIHGYRGGKAIRDMVRNEFRHPRVKQKMLSLNDGQTTFLLK